MSRAVRSGFGGSGPDAVLAETGCARTSLGPERDAGPGFNPSPPRAVDPPRCRELAGSFLMVCGIIAAAVEALVMVATLAAAMLERVAW